MQAHARFLLAVLVVFWSAVSPAAAQDTPSGLRGVVRDETGEPILGAEVVVTTRDSATRHRTAVGVDGTWSIVPLRSGTYSVEIRALGFRPWRGEAIVGLGIGLVPTVAMARAVLPLDAVVVTASRRLQKLADVPVPTELITREQIERSGASDVAQVLLEQTGIEIQGGHPVGTGVFLQGLGDQRVLVLLDGQPVVGRIAGMVDISRIPVIGIERIEVVKGPQSTLYGSAAMGGVVNIVTRPTPDHRPEAEAVVTGGDQGRREGAFRFGTGGDKIGFTAELGRRSNDVIAGNSDTSDASTESWDAALKTDLRFGSSTTAQVSLTMVDEKQQWREPPLYYTYDNLQWNARSTVKWTEGSHRVEVTGYAAGFDHLSRRSNQPTPPEGTGTEETQGLLKLDGLYGLTTGRHALDLGLVFQQDRIRSDRVEGHARDQYLFEPFAQYGLNFRKVGFLAGARVSSSSHWGTAVTPQLSVRWQAGNAIAIRSSVGRGYRIPEFKETAITHVNVPAGYVVVGNPLLEPEHSGTASLGIEVAPGGTYARTQVFYTRYENFIEEQLVSDTGDLDLWTYQNRASGTTAGVELEAGALVGWLRLEGSYSWLQTYDDETGGPLLNRPEHSARATAQVAVPAGLRVGTTAVFTGETPVERDSTDAISSIRSSWLRFDARAAYPLGGVVDLALGVENVFDQRPEGWPGYTGRRIYLSCSWRLGGIGAGVRSNPR